MTVTALLAPVLDAARRHKAAVTLFAADYLDLSTRRAMNTARRADLTAAWASATADAEALELAATVSDAEWAAAQAVLGDDPEYLAFAASYTSDPSGEAARIPGLEGDIAITSGAAYPDPLDPRIDLQPHVLDLDDTAIRPDGLEAVNAYARARLREALPLAVGETELAPWDAWRTSGGTLTPAFRGWLAQHRLLVITPPAVEAPTLTAGTIPTPTTPPTQPGPFTAARRGRAPGSTGNHPGKVLIPPPRAVDGVTGAEIAYRQPAGTTYSFEETVPGGYQWVSTLGRFGASTGSATSWYAREFVTGERADSQLPPSAATVLTAWTADVAADPGLAAVNDVIGPFATADAADTWRNNEIARAAYTFGSASALPAERVDTIIDGQVWFTWVRVISVVHVGGVYVERLDQYEWVPERTVTTTQTIPPLTFRQTVNYDGSLAAYGAWMNLKVFARDARASNFVEVRWINAAGMSLPRSGSINSNDIGVDGIYLRPVVMARATTDDEDDKDQEEQIVIVAAADHVTAVRATITENRPEAEGTAWTGASLNLGGRSTGQTGYWALPEEVAARGHTFTVQYHATRLPPYVHLGEQVQASYPDVGPVPNPFPTFVTIEE